MSRVTVNTRPVAQAYASPGETIIEYTAAAPAGDGSALGGLISFRLDAETGILTVDLYRHDPAVMVRVGSDAAAPEPAPGWHVTTCGRCGGEATHRDGCLND